MSGWLIRAFFVVVEKSVSYTIALFTSFWRRYCEIVFNNNYWTSISNWHYVIGNLSEDTFYQHGMFLSAIHKVYLGAEGWLPIRLINSELTAQTYDENIRTPNMENRDFTYYTLEATISDDPNEPGWDKPRPLPIKRDPVRALEFWRWWLFEAIPEAATVDIEQLDWSTTFSPYRGQKP